MKNTYSFFALLIGLAGIVTLLHYFAAPQAVRADSLNRYVAASGSDLANDCLNKLTPCQTIQHAIDQAASGDSILIAEGLYNQINSHAVPSGYAGSSTLYQVVYIGKNITMFGGYDSSFTEPPDYINHPTIIDAHGAGRAIFIFGTTTVPVVVTVEGLWITGGNANGLSGESAPVDAGGGVFAGYATVAVQDNQVYSNTADYGGGVYFRESDVRLESNTIISNTADFSGGGLVLYNSEGTVSGNHITSNTSEDYGGGLYVQSFSGSILSNTITLNHADYGGGIFSQWTEGFALSDNAISDNFTYNGGGVFLNDSDPELEDNLILANQGHDGCGVYMIASSPVFTNNVVADNYYPSFDCAGIFIRDGSNPLFTHNTIARNGGDNGWGIVAVKTIYGNSCSVTLTNTIIVDHGTGIQGTEETTFHLEATLWHNTYNWQGGGTIETGSYNLFGDASFAGDGFHLLPDSPAIEGGVNTSIFQDIDHDPRPNGWQFDLGADEYDGPMYVIFLPTVKR